MPDRYLLESSAVDGYLMEDGLGVLLLQFSSAIYAPSGGVAFSGAPAQIHTKVLAVSGGITMGGAPALIHEKIFNVSAGVVFGGIAAITFTPAAGASTPQRTVVGSGI